MANLAAYPKDSLAGPTPTLPVASEIQAQLKPPPAPSPQFANTRERSNVIRDTQTPAGQPPRDWNISSKEDGSAAEDYFLVCRVKTPIAGGAQFVVAGVKQFGTEAAGRLVADLEQLGAIPRTLPPGWENQNLQLVLHSRVISNTTAQPEVVAWHVW